MFASPPTASELSHRRINALCQQPTSSEDGVRVFAPEGRLINANRAGGPPPSRGLGEKAPWGEAGATPLGSRLEGLGARSRRHCQRSRAFGCSAYRQSGTAEIDRRWPK